MGEKASRGERGKKSDSPSAQKRGGRKKSSPSQFSKERWGRGKKRGGNAELDPLLCDSSTIVCAERKKNLRGEKGKKRKKKNEGKKRRKIDLLRSIHLLLCHHSA